MATKIPNPLARRHVLERDLDPAKARAVADAYLAEDRHMEAIAFLQKAEATDALEELRREAVGSGDVFLLRETSQALGVEIDARTWNAVADAAAAADKDSYAAVARRQAAAGER